MSYLVLALRFLTIVPVPGREAAEPGALGRAAWWFPAVGLALFIEASAVDAMSAPRHPAVLLLAPAVGRLAPVLIGPLFPAATPGEGAGADFLAGLSPWATPLHLSALWALSAFLLGAWGGLLLSISLASALLWAVFMVSRMGGLTGDVLGGSVEIGELATLSAAASLIHLQLI